VLHTLDFILATFSHTDNVVLRGKPIDLYQIHFPGSWSNEEYWDGIADAYDQGLVNAVGMHVTFLQAFLLIT
jgi:aryl-alcohol dehydrogenase-like predicted oxidoreductase